MRVLAEPIDSQRQDHITVVDLRLERVFSLPDMRGGRLSGFIDVYNMLNANPEQNMSWASGSAYLRPLNIVPPRIVRFGAKFEW